ncbi:ecdysteroid-phosphate phosphatase-like [Planococcus citri]|uniref:ecdysteroid-phosphate phosphatase-like n=1 Tax=Planococcus citri TaxID=170843 RepID=UPI0031F85295
MDSTRTLPPRKNLTPTRLSKQYLSPLQTLLQMGFQRHRAEKALAATGHRGAQLAADWLLAHVNDPTLDSPSPREYILYACPYGEFVQQLEVFWNKTREECGWNGALNFIPHVTLVSFFKAPDDCSLQLVQTLDQVVKQELEAKDNVDGFTLEPYISPNFMGLFISEDNSTVLKRIALQYVKEVSNAIINDNYEQLDAIATCFPWCTTATSRFSILPKNMQSISLEPHVKSLHLTLAYQFQPDDFEKLKQLIHDTIDSSLLTQWEIRLYSRDTRVAGKLVYKVIYSHLPKESDELELRIGDFIYVNEDAVANSPDGWVEGTSWLTGCSGLFPINYTERTAETDSWTLHKSVPLFEQDNEPEAAELPVSDYLCTSNMTSYDNASTASMCSLNTNEAENNAGIQNKPSSDILVMRHGERVDFTFGNWIPTCFNKEGKYIRTDLNMPVILPQRQNYPNSFKEDTPLTNVGLLEAKLTGEALGLDGITVKYAYCSPALRCVQTCHSLLTGMGISDKLPIRIEPGLFEWLTWYTNYYPEFMTDDELIAAGYDIDKTYEPFMTRDELKTHLKENCDQYYSRNFEVVKKSLKTADEQGPGYILIVAHASSLDTCSRQLMGLEPRKEEAMSKIMMKVPYCSVVHLEKQNSLWTLNESPVPSISHSLNKRFDYKVLIDE